MAIYDKQNGIWDDGLFYIKVNGTWVAPTFYEKRNGEWVAVQYNSATHDLILYDPTSDELRTIDGNDYSTVLHSTTITGGEFSGTTNFVYMSYDAVADRIILEVEDSGAESLHETDPTYSSFSQWGSVSSPTSIVPYGSSNQYLVALNRGTGRTASSAFFYSDITNVDEFNSDGSRSIVNADSSGNGDSDKRGAGKDRNNATGDTVYYVSGSHEGYIFRATLPDDDWANLPSEVTAVEHSLGISGMRDIAVHPDTGNLWVLDDTSIYEFSISWSGDTATTSQINSYTLSNYSGGSNASFDFVPK